MLRRETTPDPFFRPNTINVTMTPITGGSEPVVVEVSSQYAAPDRHAYYLDGVDLDETFTATVEWNGHTPGAVRFITPNGIFYGSGGGETWTFTFNMGTDFGTPQGTLVVQAVADGGSPASEPHVVNLEVVSSVPGIPSIMLGHDPSSPTLKYTVAESALVHLLEEGVEYGVIPEEMPLFGDEAFKVTSISDIPLEVHGDGTARADILEYTAGAPATIAGLEFVPWATGHLSWTYVPSQGQWLPGGHLERGAAGGGDVPPNPAYFPLGPCPLCVPAYWRGHVDIALLIELELATWAGPTEPVWTGTAELDPFPDAEAVLGVGVADLLAVEGYLGGGARMTLQYPDQPTLERLQMFLAGGARLVLFFAQFEWPLLECSWDYYAGGGGCNWGPATAVSSRSSASFRVTTSGGLEATRFSLRTITLMAPNVTK